MPSCENVKYRKMLCECVSEGHLLSFLPEQVAKGIIHAKPRQTGDGGMDGGGGGGGVAFAWMTRANSGLLIPHPPPLPPDD